MRIGFDSMYVYIDDTPFLAQYLKAQSISGNILIFIDIYTGKYLSQNIDATNVDTIRYYKQGDLNTYKDQQCLLGSIKLASLINNIKEDYLFISNAVNSSSLVNLPLPVSRYVSHGLGSKSLTVNIVKNNFYNVFITPLGGLSVNGDICNCLRKLYTYDGITQPPLYYYCQAGVEYERYESTIGVSYNTGNILFEYGFLSSSGVFTVSNPAYFSGLNFKTHSFIN